VRILKTIAETRNLSRELCHAGNTLGLVPTMGALHEGHLALVHAAQVSCDRVAVSIFVNPAQFGPNEDFARYPRTFAEDCRMLETAGIEFVFAPTVEEIYPPGAAAFVDVGEVGDRLDGASRPGHFRGVATIVAKLFHIVEPDRAFFGQKDAAQVAVLQKMVRDLDFALELIVCPTVREPDGLALSSRNRYLNPNQRRQALVLSRSLDRIRQLVQEGEYESRTLIAEALRIFALEPAVRLDYFAIVDPQTLLDVPDVRSGALAAVAAFVGQTRLIDNFLLPARE
jgi:pantoate--beta-alanine ligase